VEQARDATIVRRTADSRWLKIFLFLTGVLASTILLKVGQVQYLEILYFIELLVLLIAFANNGYKVRWFRPYSRIAICYLLFSFATLVLSIGALRYEFYFPDGVNFLKYPVVITISRIIELLASVSIMLYLAGKFREDRSKAAFAMRVYFWVGFASAVFSIVSYPLSIAKIIDLGTYGNSHRMRGFYNEGGPYGLYLISVFLVGIALYKRGWVAKYHLRFAFVILVIAFLGSQSKAAFCAILVILLVNGLLTRNFGRRMMLVAAIAIALVTIYQVVDLGAALRNYQRLSQAYEWLSHRHAKDGNFVLGRVAGAFIVPKMVEQHPVVGVGWGNYGLVRDAPEYRGAAAFAPANDDPGLGIVGMTAELGIPLVFYLGICLILPFVYLRRRNSPLYLTNLALLQPVVHLFGGQLNLTYPWIVTAFALGLGYSFRDETAVENPMRLS
jgi:hypothetical protein